MNSTTKHEATIEADPNLPTITITREFDAPPEQGVPRLHRSRAVRPVAGPDAHRPREIDARGTPAPAASGATSAVRDGEEIAGFYGSLPRGAARTSGSCRPSRSRASRTASSLETMTFEDARGRPHAGSRRRRVVDSIETRDAILSSGMEVGVDEGYEKLDELLSAGAGMTARRGAPRIAGGVHRPGAGGASDLGRPRPGRGLGRARRRPSPGGVVPRRSSSPAPASSCASGPSVDEDPVAAWQVHCDAVQALLDDPATARKVLSNPHIGDVPLDQAVDQFYTSDVFMHTWDLARATGQDETLDPDEVRRAARRDGADGRGPALQRPVRPAGRGARRTPTSRPGCSPSSAATRR